MRIALRFPAENRTIGFLAGTPGYALGTRAVPGGAALRCPRCRNPVVLAEHEDIPLVPGTLRFGPGEVIHADAPAG